MESIISTFHIDWKIIIAQAINFAIVFAVLYVYALKPLSKLMKERSEKIEKGIQDAKQNSEILKKSEEEYKVALDKARAEAVTIFDTAKKEGEAKRTEMVENTKKEVSAMIESGKKTLEAEKAKMVLEARNEIAMLALEASEKLLAMKADKAFDTKSAKELGNL